MATHIARPLGFDPNCPLGFYEYIPDVPPQRILISIHGYGQRGNGTTELSKVLNEAMAREIKGGRHNANAPAIILSPQYSGNKIPWEVMDKFIKWACSFYKISRKQINFDGISGGGICVMEYLYNYKKANPDGHPDSVEVDRAVLVAACYMDASKASLFGSRTYLWVIHGTTDTQCSFNSAKALYEAYKALGGRVRTTYFPWMAHTGTVWNTAYGAKEVKDWITLYS